MWGSRSASKRPDKQKKELEELCKTLVADTEGPDMAVDGNGPGSAESQRLILQEVHMMRDHINHMDRPDPELEKQTNLLKKQRGDLYDFHCKEKAKRQKTHGVQCGAK